jgi:hypothetical protein
MLSVRAMPPTDLESPPDSPPANSLEYVRASSPVTRRQFRFLVFLTLFNTILLATFIAGPTVSQFTRTTLQDYKTRRQIRQQIQQQDALLQQAGAYTAPPDQVVYEENPDDARKLATSPDYSALSTRQFLFSPSQPDLLQRPVWRRDPTIVASLRQTIGSTGVSPTLLLHTLKSPGGQQRLVWVVIHSEQRLDDVKDTYHNTNLQRHASVLTHRQITAMIIDHVQTNQPVQPLTAKSHVHLVPQTPGVQTTVLLLKDAATETPRITITPKGLFRFYAAQVDSQDPSHFTIDYTLDGKRNTIDGYLKDNDRIIFIVRAGRIIGDTSGGKVWNPLDTAATQP